MINFPLVCPCNLQCKKNENKLITCKSCKTQQHIECMSQSKNMTNFQCPRCQIQKMDPHVEVQDSLCTPGLLKYKPDVNDIRINFALSNTIFNIVENYRSQCKKNPDIHQEPLFLMIRCLRLDETGYEHHWPLNGSLNVTGFIGGKDFNIPKYPPRSKPRYDYPLVYYFTDKDKQLDVNKYLPKGSVSSEFFRNFNELSTLNEIKLISKYAVNDDDKFGYYISVDLVKIKTSMNVIDSTLKIEDINHLKFLRGIIEGQEENRESLNLNFGLGNTSIEKKKTNKEKTLENNLLISSEIVCLEDQYNSKKIKYPCRSMNCTHMEVFDLETFLVMNKLTKKYVCPVCKIKCVRFYIDVQIQNLSLQYPKEAELKIDYDYNIVSVIDKDKEGDNANDLIKNILMDKEDKSIPIINNSNNLQTNNINNVPISNIVKINHQNINPINKNKSSMDVETVILLDDEQDDKQKLTAVHPNNFMYNTVPQNNINQNVIQNVSQNVNNQMNQGNNSFKSGFSHINYKDVTNKKITYGDKQDIDNAKRGFNQTPNNQNPNVNIMNNMNNNNNLNLKENLDKFNNKLNSSIARQYTGTFNVQTSVVPGNIYNSNTNQNDIPPNLHFKKLNQINNNNSNLNHQNVEMQNSSKSVLNNNNSNNDVVVEEERITSLYNSKHLVFMDLAAKFYCNITNTVADNFITILSLNKIFDKESDENDKKNFLVENKVQFLGNENFETDKNLIVNAELEFLEKFSIQKDNEYGFEYDDYTSFYIN